MGPDLRGAAVIQGGQGRPPLQSKTGTAQNGTAGTACPTHSVIARSEATRQSVLPCPKRRISTPVCTPRALASRRALARNDSVARWERRDTWVPPYGVRRSFRADRVVRPYKAKQEPRKTGRRGRRPLHTLSLRGAKRRGNPFSPSPKRRIPTPVCTPRALASRRALARNDSASRCLGGQSTRRRGTRAPPYRVRRSYRADRVVRPCKGLSGILRGTSRTPSPTGGQERGTAGALMRRGRRTGRPDSGGRNPGGRRRGRRSPPARRTGTASRRRWDPPPPAR